MKRKSVMTLLLCLLALLVSVSTVCGAETQTEESPKNGVYCAAPSARGAVSQYMTAIENNVKDYNYKNRYIDYRVVPKEVPILMFHHISDEPDSPLTSDSFRRYMVELAENGYETIFYDDLYAFVKDGTKLPDKPIVITFDDGYLSNYQYAYPILKGLGMKAEISIVGSTVGRDTHPETGKPIIPHFSWEQAREMVKSGVIRIRSHSFDMHQHVSAEDVSRIGVIKNSFESESLYSSMFSGDCKRMKDLIQQELGYDDLVFTYPYGKYNRLTENILTNLKYKITISIDTGSNKVRVGNMSSLRGMKRIACDTNDSESIIARIKYYSN